MNSDSEILVGLSIDELEALANSRLAPVDQSRLDSLLSLGKSLSAEDGAELDALLRQIDQLTILKTRARYTLNHERAETAGS